MVNGITVNGIIWLMESNKKSSGNFDKKRRERPGWRER
jgi:hypothetical protein